MEVPNKPGRPEKEWLDNMTKWCNMGIYSVCLEQRRTENGGQQLWKQQWTPTSCGPQITKTRFYEPVEREK